VKQGEVGQNGRHDMRPSVDSWSLEGGAAMRLPVNPETCQVAL